MTRPLICDPNLQHFSALGVRKLYLLAGRTDQGGQPLSSLSIQTGAAHTVANHQIIIHMADEFIGEKKATRSQKINVMEREGGCTMFLLPAAWATWCPKHPSRTMDFAKPQCEAHSPMGQLSPSPSIGPGGQIWHSLPGTGCKHNFTDFGSPPRAGQTYPRVLEKGRSWHSLPCSPESSSRTGWDMGSRQVGAVWAPAL